MIAAKCHIELPVAKHLIARFVICLLTRPVKQNPRFTRIVVKTVMQSLASYHITYLSRLAIPVMRHSSSEERQKRVQLSYTTPYLATAKLPPGNTI